MGSLAQDVSPSVAPDHRDRVVFLQPGQTVPRDAVDSLHSFNVSTPALAILGALQDAGYQDLHFLDVACEEGWGLHDFNDALLTKGLPLPDVLDRLEALAPRFVLVTSMFTCDFPVTDELCRAVKERLSDEVTLIVGGRHASLLPHWHLDGGAVDFLVQGEGEEVIVRLLDHLTGRDGGDPPGDLPGVLSPGRRPALSRDAWESVELGGSFAWDLVLRRPDGRFRYQEVVIDTSPKDRFYKRSASTLHSAPILPSRGCPYCCRFCGSHAGTHLRSPGADRLFADVQRCYEQGARLFFNVSENLCLADDDRELIRRMADWRETLDDPFVTCNPNSSFLPIYLDVDRSVNLELVRLMRRAGFDLMTISLETTSPRFDDKRLFRRYSTGDLERLFAAFAEEGLDTHLYMMSGFPGQTLAELETDVDLVRRWADAGLVAAASWSNLIYIPGTTYYEEALAEGRFTEESYRRRLEDGFNFFAVNDAFNFTEIPTETLAGVLARLRRGEYEV